MSLYTVDFGNGSLPKGLVQNGKDLSQTIYVRPLSSYVKNQPEFALYELAIRTQDGVQRHQVHGKALLSWARKEGSDVNSYLINLLERLDNPLTDYAGLSVTGRPLIMGIVNVTPDSFSDGGDNFDASHAIAHGKQLLAQGADILDIGGESTRPGAAPVSLEEELRRVVPVIEGLKDTGAKISIDTRNAPVMEAAIKAGAHIINDVTALEGQGALDTAIKLDVPVMLMHMQGEPQTMQENPVYEDCVLDVYDYLKDRINMCIAAGIKRANICIDPGIGFGKTLDHNMAILNQLSLYHGLGCPVLLGASRKSFIPKICGDVAPKDRIAGSLAAAIKGAQAATQIVRVHDVFETKQALDVWGA